MRKKRTQATVEAARKSTREYIDKLEGGEIKNITSTPLGFRVSTLPEVGDVIDVLYDGREVQAKVKSLDLTTSGTKICVLVGAVAIRIDPGQIIRRG